MIALRILSKAVLVASTLSATGAELARDPLPTCFHEASVRYGVDERLLRAIGKVESNFDPAAVHHDSDGTHDVGVMQVNSSHFDELGQWGITETVLLTNPCTNVSVGAWILAGFIQRHGLTWRAVGSYGAGTSPNKEAARLVSKYE